MYIFLIKKLSFQLISGRIAGQMDQRTETQDKLKNLYISINITQPYMFLLPYILLSVIWQDLNLITNTM
jgi:hypothetical protein